MAQDILPEIPELHNPGHFTLILGNRAASSVCEYFTDTAGLACYTRIQPDGVLACQTCLQQVDPGFAVAAPHPKLHFDFVAGFYRYLARFQETKHYQGMTL